MLRPGGFPEFNPQQQYIFDSILATVTKVFEQHNFSHIRTPAVEPVEILKKGGDVVDKQVYGLFGLAQGVEDVKDFALHFDLTVPLARYVIDHKNDLTFPFKRYQMQPVWRGERTQRGRFKEFRQFDVDVLRPSASNVGVWYDTETIAVMSKAMDAVCNKFNMPVDRILKISHLGLTKSFLQSHALSEESMNEVLGLLDGYFKIGHEKFAEKLATLVPTEVCKLLHKLIEGKDFSALSQYDGYEDLKAIFDGLDKLGVSYEYDICIVRGHNYYKGMVCEWFEKTDVAFGSLAAGGRYDHITDFIDPKQSFSGVGTSLGRFVYMMVDKIGEIQKEDSYMFVNFEDTYSDIVALYSKFLDAGKICEMYPTAAKIGKQFEYADKKGITHVVVLGGGEKEENIFKIKNLLTGVEDTYTEVFAYGAIVTHKDKLLLVKSNHGFRGLPKGKAEKNESPEEVAIRELAEETGITDVKRFDGPMQFGRYFYTNGENVLKTVGYKICKVKNDKVVIQQEELADYGWFTTDEAQNLVHNDIKGIIQSIKL